MSTRQRASHGRELPNIRQAVVLVAVLSVNGVSGQVTSEENESEVAEILSFAQPIKTSAYTEPTKAGTSVFLDNDVFGARQEDRDYTQGVMVQVSGDWVREKRLDSPHNWLDARLRIAGLHNRLAVGDSRTPVLSRSVQFGVSAFTPEDLGDALPIFDDRPYGSLAYFTTRHQTVGRNRTVALTSEFTVGLLGTGVADWFQTRLHEHLQDYPGDTPLTPRGWQHQISDGGEPTVRYGLKRQKLLGECQFYDAQLITEANAGYYTNAAVAGAVRFGRIRSPWWQFEAAPIAQASFVTQSSSVRDDPASSCRHSRSPDAGFELYVWAGASMRAWLYNSLLQGQVRDSVVTVSSSNLERLVYDHQVGLTLRFEGARRWHTITYAQAGRSEEFEGPRAHRHTWGGLYYSWTNRPR